MRILIAFLIMGTWGWREGRIVSSICERRNEIEAGWFEGFLEGGEFGIVVLEGRVAR
jgi:hypothetical protein